MEVVSDGEWGPEGASHGHLFIPVLIRKVRLGGVRLDTTYHTLPTPCMKPPPHLSTALSATRGCYEGLLNSSIVIVYLASSTEAG